MKRSKKTNSEKFTQKRNSRKLAILISESSVFTDSKGHLISKGGGESSFHKLAMALVQLGLAVKVVAIQEFSEQKAHEFIDGVEYVRLPVKSKTSFRIFGYLKRAIAEARGDENGASDRTGGADYVFVNQFSPHLVLPFVGRGRRTKNGSMKDGSTKDGSMKDGSMKDGKRCKKIAVIHDVYKGKGVGFWIKQFGLFAGIIGSIVERFQLRFDRKYADEILTVSEESKKKILSAFGGNDNGNDKGNENGNDDDKKKFNEKIRIVTWPTDEKPGNQTNLKDKKDFILFVGRFVDYKNPSHVLHVLKEIKRVWPRFQAVFVASRSDKKTMTEFTDTRYKLSLTARDVVIEESISNDKLQAYYKAAKLLVHPSFVEGQGMVIPEALSWKTPVIAYDLPAYNAFASEKGLIKIPKSKGHKGLAEACLKVLGNYEGYFRKTNEASSTNKKEFIEVVKKVVLG